MADRRNLRQRGFSTLEAGRRCHIPLRTVHRWAHKFKNYGEFQRCYSTGRPHCSTREVDKAVCRVHEDNPFCYANQIRDAANFPGTARTIMNHLRGANIYCRKVASKEGLIEGQAINCLPFTTSWRDFNWGNVIFTNETAISSNCESRGLVYRESGTRYDTRYIQ